MTGRIAYGSERHRAMQKRKALGSLHLGPYKGRKGGRSRAGAKGNKKRR